MTVKVFLLSCCTLLFSSCATIITGSKATVVIDGSLNAPVTIQAGELTYERVDLPQQIEMPRRHLDYPINVSLDSAHSVSVKPGTKMNMWFWGNLLGPGLIGMLVDGLTYSAVQPRYNTFFIQEQDTLGTRILTAHSYPEPKKHKKDFFHHEIGTNVGFLSCVGRNRMDKTGAFLEHQLGCEVGDQCNYFGPVSLGLHYYYHLDSRWGVGLAYQYAYGYKPYDKMSEQQPVGWCDVLVRSHSLMAAVKRQWLECGSLSFYSKVALGFQHRHVYCSFRDAMQQTRTPDDKRWLLAYQLSPACMEVGNRVRFFMEWGYGQEGVFTIGLSTRI